MWNTETFRPSSSENEMDQTIKIIKQTIVNNEVAKVGSVHTVPKHVAHMHVTAENAEYLEKETATNRAIGAEGSDSDPKKRKKK